MSTELNKQSLGESSIISKKMIFLKRVNGDGTSLLQVVPDFKMTNANEVIHKAFNGSILRWKNGWMICQSDEGAKFVVEVGVFNPELFVNQALTELNKKKEKTHEVN